MMTDLVQAPDFYRLFLFSGAFVGFIVSSACILYVYATIRTERRAQGSPSDRRLMLAFYRLSGLNDAVLLYFAVYFFLRITTDATVQAGIIYYAAVFGYALAIFALALPGISAAFIARSLNRGRRRVS